jgi:outer membrane protein OmpA-like peptidoglycan-associated protein/opacity protein-like surface antigen
MRLTILLLTCSLLTNAQSKLTSFNPYSGTLVLTAMGGITLGNTDFESTKPGFSGGGMVEYFIPGAGSSIFGIRAHYTGNTIVGKETSDLPGFKTDIYSLGTGISYMYSVENIFFPYAFAGISMANFTPTVNGTQPPNLRSTSYRTSTFSYSFDIGARVLISPNVSLNLTFNYNLPQTDNLDDISYLDNNDKFVSINAGISFSLLGSTDFDNDGINDKYDSCPREAEDMDGFEDDDGCPDPDNDNDGIPDILDKCPNQAEDFDGFEDGDGCPDNDNDKDGIFDTSDKCPNLSEDLDGYQDDDGCPDLDNDHDGIPDSDDKCPNSPEDIDGFEDYDGCPDFDNDKDGINDKYDKCPDNPETFNGYEDQDGCPDVAPVINEPGKKSGQSITVPNIVPRKPDSPDLKKSITSADKIPERIILDGVLTFEDDKARIKNNAYDELDKIAGYMKKNPGVKWRIEGYTDKIPGSNEKSDLGGKRANEVLLYLVKKGVPLSQMEVVDMGDKYPRSSNDKPSGRALNRRVEIKKVK